MPFEAKVLKEEGMDFGTGAAALSPALLQPHRLGGYSAGYYAYIWSEVLDADTVEWLKANGGLKRANGDKLRAKLLSRGGSEDAMVLFRNLVGHEPDIKPLLERRGLVVREALRSYKPVQVLGWAAATPASSSTRSTVSLTISSMVFGW